MAVNKKFAKSIKMGKELLATIIDTHTEGIEKAWINREEDEAIVIDFKMKLLPKNKDDIKVETHIGYNPEKKVKDSNEKVVTNQTKIPGMD